MHKPYEQDYFTAKPTKFTLALRTNILWQILRFVYINLKMTSMIIKSHNDKLDKKEQPK